jgi:hypothetical protein
MTDRKHAFLKSALILLCLFLVFSGSCKTSGNDQGGVADGNFSAEQLRADFNQLRSALESNHPDRLRYETAATLGALFDAAYDSLQDDMSEGEFYRVVAPLVARTHCGHTQIRPSNGFFNALETSGSVLPLGIYLADGRAYVDADYGSLAGIRLGCEVLSINNEPIGEIVGRMLAGISADALNTSRKVHILNRQFFLYYYYFWGEKPGFDLVVRDPAAGSESQVRVNARPYDEVNRDANNRFATSSSLSLEIEGDLAVMTVPSFVVSQNPDYRAFFENSFRQLNALGVGRLIVDIRGNGGGDPELSVALIAHLIDHPFVYFKTGLGYPNLFAETPPHAVHFNGTVRVLIDGGCFSTSGHFCSMVRYHELATFVGETGGGAFRCHDNSTDYVLNNARIRLHVARTTYETAVPDQDVSQGFPPDFRVVPTIQDVLSGSDPQMDFAARQGEGGK